jgi:hypothetical protein
MKRWTGRSSTTEARTEVAKRVLEFVDELYEIVIHDYDLCRVLGFFRCLIVVGGRGYNVRTGRT